jgi:predicted molibdopterin-dependent oxidoreductase YjgC
MGDDPAGSDPDLKQVLEKVEFLVVQDIFMTETAKLAHVVLPAASSAEKSGTFTNLERRLQQLNKAEEPIGESRPDWEIIQDIAKNGRIHNYGSARTSSRRSGPLSRCTAISVSGHAGHVRNHL